MALQHISSIIQGDHPLSSFLFFFYHYGHTKNELTLFPKHTLSHMLDVADGGGFISSFSVGSANFGVVNNSHLFAHDILLFCKANLGHIQIFEGLLALL